MGLVFSAPHSFRDLAIVVLPQEGVDGRNDRLADFGLISGFRSDGWLEGWLDSHAIQVGAN